MANNSLQLELVTPSRVMLSTDTSFVALPGSEGELGVLPGHIAVLTQLKNGVLGYQEKGGKTVKVAIHGGYAEVKGNKVTVLAELAEHGSEIDLDRAVKAQRKAEETLRGKFDSSEAEQLRMKKYEAKLLRAFARQGAAK